MQKKFIVVSFIIILLFIFIGCSIYNKKDNKTNNEIPTTIGDIAYDKNSTYGYRVYIYEDNELTPFLVLTSNYGGNCLLLREFILDELEIYNNPEEYSSYYNNSYIDKYLNEIYTLNFSQNIINMIVESNIEITSKKAIDTHEKETETILRKIFLLSADEVNSGFSYSALKEGTTLLYFKDIKNRVATYKNLEESSWGLRTPILRDSSTICGIGPDGTIGMGGINTMDGIGKIGVRPAFCIKSNTYLCSQEINGEKIFTIE